MADSWESDGNCKDCRRKNYCSKQCTKHKQRTENLIRGKIAEVIFRNTSRPGVARRTVSDMKEREQE